jgi:hypothetical protein
MLLQFATEETLVPPNLSTTHGEFAGNVDDSALAPKFATVMGYPISSRGQSTGWGDIRTARPRRPSFSFGFSARVEHPRDPGLESCGPTIKNSTESDLTFFVELFELFL